MKTLSHQFILIVVALDSPEATAYHKHKCDNCGFVWEHSDAWKENVPAHTCTKCSHIQSSKYHGDEKPAETTRPQQQS